MKNPNKNRCCISSLRLHQPSKDFALHKMNLKIHFTLMRTENQNSSIEHTINSIHAKHKLPMHINSNKYTLSLFLPKVKFLCSLL